MICLVATPLCCMTNGNNSVPHLMLNALYRNASQSKYAISCKSEIRCSAFAGGPTNNGKIIYQALYAYAFTKASWLHA